LSDAPRRGLLDLRLLLAAALLAIIGALALGGSPKLWAAGALAVTVAGSLWRWWYDTRGPGAGVLALAALWGGLPGARRLSRDTVHVHDGTQPLWIRVARSGQGRLTAALNTPVGDSPVSFRMWPRAAEAPPVDPDGVAVAGPPMERAPMLEQLFATTLRVEASDEEAAARIIEGTLHAAIAQAARDHKGELVGVTYDGRLLAVHLAGALAADPVRGAAVARSLWRVLVP
jgi:hypothetical protein